jgi:hypothetical protein
MSDFGAPRVICARHYRVLPTVDFDCQACGQAREIDDIPANRVLTPKPVRNL